MSTKKPLTERATDLLGEGDKNSDEQEPVKEQQPSREGDLSPVHNTHEVGTSGGDQRAKDTEPEHDMKKGEAVITNLDKEEVEPAPVEEPGNKADIKYDEPPKEDEPLHSDKEIRKT